MMILSTILALCINSFANSDDDTREFLKLFESNTPEAMDSLPLKYDSAGLRTSPGIKKVLNNDFFENRQNQRARMCLKTDKGTLKCLAKPGRAGIPGSEDPRFFVDNGNNLERNLVNLEKIRKARVAESPWSGDYWPMRTGQLATRYQDEKFPRDLSEQTWEDAFKYYQANPAAKVPVDILSPAEKYDLLVGDTSWSLTKSQWNLGLQYQMQYGNVESWMGICHGWAPAAFMEKRPAKSFKVLAADGKTEITFYPDDIKALASLKWANGINIDKTWSPGTRFLGGRCDKKNPKKDPQNGRLLDPECFDMNPGSWHIAVTNQVGISKRSFVLDATYDAEVWNQPVLAYSYSYFNPKTKERVETLDQAKVALPDSTDPFAKYRNNRLAKNIIGVIMDLTYIAERSPQARDSDDESRDITTTVRYIYDLEIDDNNNIIGGEWYQNRHPDFVYTPAPESFSWNEEDRFVKSTISSDFKMGIDVVKTAPLSSENGRPLKVVIDALINRSH